MVQFYVRGQDALGAISTYPAAGANSRALYQVNDGQGPTTAIDSIRIIMLPADSNNLYVNTNLMSNQDVGATVIYNNKEVFYDVGVRLKGSSCSRGDTPTWGGSYSIQLPAGPSCSAAFYRKSPSIRRERCDRPTKAKSRFSSIRSSITAAVRWPATTTIWGM